MLRSYEVWSENLNSVPVEIVFLKGASMREKRDGKKYHLCKPFSNIFQHICDQSLHLLFLEGLIA